MSTEFVYEAQTWGPKFSPPLPPNILFYGQKQLWLNVNAIGLKDIRTVKLVFDPSDHSIS